MATLESYGREVHSTPRYDCCEEAIAPMAVGATIGIALENIDVDDTATFVREIK